MLGKTNMAASFVDRDSCLLEAGKGPQGIGLNGKPSRFFRKKKNYETNNSFVFWKLMTLKLVESCGYYIH